ncbi:unnamed protein product [Rotaria magnacalcarata]|uniref:Uncharacterized protein n=3 Tax=Rotaria magnacalcarata TaxID=392030 RepID=A0A814P1X5_9BILA|nr:unnamed protein product [Rotaria magnacalcarata]CAF1328812.1 unnamed protein product [Rotaria magnacalcarata]CAF4065984.1 unnamed protein product [Rotaria magnacalcarata]
MGHMHYDEHHFNQMWNLFHRRYFVNATAAQQIRNLADDYKADQAINYYTQDSCLFRFLNEILRLENFENLFKFGCYISDLYNQLENLEKQQIQNGRQNITVFRGKKYPTQVIQQLKDSVGNLITLNGLISTTKMYNVAARFAGIGEKREGYNSVIFEFKIDSKCINLYRPCADIKTFSQFPDEKEVLFFMGFIWKIEFMDNYGTNNWYVVLESYTDYNPELTRSILDARLNYKYSDVGDILQQLSDHTSAIDFYQRMLDEDENISGQHRCHIYFNMGVIAEDSGRNLDAINYFKQANSCVKSSESVGIEESTQLKPLLAPNIAATKLHIYNNLTRVYMNIEDERSARKYFQDAVEQNGSQFEHATVLRNFGFFEFKCRKLQDAKRYLEQAVDLVKNYVCYGDFKRSLDALLTHLPTSTGTSTTSS